MYVTLCVHPYTSTTLYCYHIPLSALSNIPSEPGGNSTIPGRITKSETIKLFEAMNPLVMTVFHPSETVTANYFITQFCAVGWNTV